MENMVENKDLNFFVNKRIFITGHTGFKGSWLSYILDKNKSIVKGYSLSPNTSPSLFSQLKFSDQFSSVIADINDFEKLKQEIVSFNPDIIFHLAAQPIVIESYNNPKYTFDTNFTGTLNLLEILREVQTECVCIFITTDKVYANNEQKNSFKEDDKLGGNDPYSASKAASEILINSYFKSYFSKSNISIASVRAGNVIGGGDWSKFRLLPDIVRAHKDKSELNVRHPKAVRPWQHVLEPLFGYLELSQRLSNDKMKYSGSWNFGPKEDDIKTVSEVIQLAKSVGMDFNYSENDVSKYYESNFLSLDISKSRKILSWNPKWNSETAIIKTIEWYLGFYKKNNIEELMENDIKSYLNKK
jgi:CDP-glucose 4,6-dehydratase